MPLDFREKSQKYLSQLNMNKYRHQLICNPPTPSIYQTCMYVSTSAQEVIAGIHMSAQLPEELCTLAANLSGSPSLY